MKTHNIGKFDMITQEKKPLYLQADYIDKKIEISMLWLNCKPTHDNIYNECCHDFSCCHPDLFTQDPQIRMVRHKEFIDKLLARRNQ